VQSIGPLSASWYLGPSSLLIKLIPDLQNECENYQKNLFAATNHFHGESAAKTGMSKSRLEPQAQASEISSQAQAHFKPLSKLGLVWV